MSALSKIQCVAFPPVFGSKIGPFSLTRFHRLVIVSVMLINLWVAPVASVGFNTCSKCDECGSATAILVTDADVANEAFKGCYQLQSVTFGNTVKSIGDFAFEDCSSLTQVTFGTGLTTIGDGAFSGSGLASLALPNSVTFIGKAAHLSSTAATVPPSLTVNVEQVLREWTKASYEAEKDASELTVKHAVASNAVGVTIDQVTDITVQDVTPRVILRGLPAPDQCLLKYKVRTSDPSVTLTTLHSQLINAAHSGKMTEDLCFYAAQFGVTSLFNSTLAVPQVTNAANSHTSDGPTAGEIAGIVLGTLFLVGVLVAIVLVCMRKQSNQPETDDVAQEPSTQVATVYA